MREIIVELNVWRVFVNFCSPWILKTDPQKDYPSFLPVPITHPPAGTSLLSATSQ